MKKIKDEKKKSNKKVIDKPKKNMVVEKPKKEKNFLERTKTKFKKFKDNPSLFMSNLLNKIWRIVKDNRLYFIFVFINVLNGALLRAFTLGTNTIFNLDALLADTAFMFIIGSFAYLFHEKGRFIYTLLVTIILTLICVINSAYYTFYTSFSSISLLSTARFITDQGDAVTQNVLQPKDLVYLLMPLSYIFLHHRYKKTNKLKLFRSKLGFFKSLTIGVVSAIIFSMTLTGTDVGRLTKQWNREYVVKKFGIYIYHVNDLVKSLEPKFAALFGYDSALKEFNEYYMNVETPTKNEYTNKYAGKNIIVIHGESIQNFVIGLKFNGQEVTPNLNKLASKGLYFNNFYTQVSVGTSSDTEFTFNTSLMPANIGTAFSDYADKEYVSIPKLLKEQGYYSFAMHANNGEYWNRRVMHKNLGYDDLIAKDQYEIDEVIGLGLSDASFFKQSIPKIKEIAEKHEKFYGTIIMLSNHTPFSDTDKYGEFDVDIKETVKNAQGVEEEVSYPYLEGTKLGNYLKSVHYADYALGIFLEGLEEEGLLDNTVIVFYGDHDARLPQSNFVRMYNYDKENDSVLDEDDPNYVEFNDYHYELNRKVPFIIWSKETEKNPKTYNYIMGMYDVMPTLGNMFGFYNKYALGHDIFDVKENNIVVFPTSNWLTKDLYYNNQREEYFALSDSVINQEQIEENRKYTDKLLSVSNDILVYNLIKNSREQTVDETSVVEGK